MLKLSIIMFICWLIGSSLNSKIFSRKKSGIVLTYDSKTYGESAESILFTTTVKHFQTLTVTDEKLKQSDPDLFTVHIWIKGKLAVKTFLICSLINLTAEELKAGVSYNDDNMKDKIFIKYNMLQYNEIQYNPKLIANIYITINRQYKKITLKPSIDYENFRKITNLNSIKEFPDIGSNINQDKEFENHIELNMEDVLSVR